MSGKGAKRKKSEKEKVEVQEKLEVQEDSKPIEEKRLISIECKVKELPCPLCGEMTKVRKHNHPDAKCPFYISCGCLPPPKRAMSRYVNQEGEICDSKGKVIKKPEGSGTKEGRIIENMDHKMEKILSYLQGISKDFLVLKDNFNELAEICTISEHMEDNNSG
jgi:hypothetical protein